MNDGNISTPSEDVEDLSPRAEGKSGGYRRSVSPVEKLDYYEMALTSPDEGRFIEALKGRAVGKIWKIVYDPLSDTMNDLRALDKNDERRHAELTEQLRLQAETVCMYFTDLKRRVVEVRGDAEADARRLLDGRLEVVFGDLERYVGTFVEASHLDLAIEHYERCILLLGSHSSPAACLLSITAGLQRRRLSKVCYDLLRHNPERDGPDALISKIKSTARHLNEVPEASRPFAKSILDACISSLREQPYSPEPLKLAGLVMVDEPARTSPGTWHWLVLLTAAITQCASLGGERGPVKSLISSIGATLALEPAMDACRISESALWCSLLLCLEFMGPYWHGDADVDGIVKAHCAEYAVSAAEDPWTFTVLTDIFNKNITPAELSGNPSGTMASRLVQSCLHISTKTKTRGVLSIPKEVSLKRIAEPMVDDQSEKGDARRSESKKGEGIAHSKAVNHHRSPWARCRTDRWGSFLSEGDPDDESTRRRTAVVRSHAPGRHERPSESEYKPLVLIDGPNVANRHGGQQFTCKGLQICVDYYISRGHEVMVFLPDYLVNRNELFKLRNAQKMRVQTVHGIKAAPTHIPVDNIGILLKLQTQGRLALTPSKDYDDSYCLQYAHRKDAVIVSNDMYRDWVKKQPSWKKSESILWLRTHVISYTFVKDEFMPNPDFSMPVPKVEPPV
ncbi:hypothetical protein Pmar_PMAR015292 [Perkinsus marinus ATCC 50983]|uniref:RNase NYN domain-containing protein n=1 Tax=Perkinsus marinus (strain ATCC 50983 / TXsc) TaxID=423536 RepID=C5KL87_PERM5|nr:hypothetical protein Pmar_PMAR015292 [Perkinsus marinus ATCC 50983]EER14760.1 hypothetical protein Pmar_PMAR015292 [Perkinsus marinus ATCC 50983]|eukprot:XP_002782964.1 hypothetical protein Pmar_PMAR015292 [Perkinsus marinus ATCC 50983]